VGPAGAAGDGVGDATLVAVGVAAATAAVGGAVGGMGVAVAGTAGVHPANPIINNIHKLATIRSQRNSCMFISPERAG